tara:strand:+ start:12900 stop:13097 length:198 start_codon:yes stop_codon:yes gene_type:complete
MTDIDILKNYLRSIEVFTGSPIFEKTIKEMTCIDPRGHWDEYYMTPPFWQLRPVNVHESGFKGIA